MPDRRGSRRLGVLFVAGVLAVLLGGCVAAPPPRPAPWEARLAVAQADPVEAYAAARLASMTLPEKVAALLMIHVPGTDPGTIRGVVDSTGVSGIIDMGDNVPGSAAALAAVNAQLSADPGLPLLIGIDQEGATVRRLPGDGFPAAPQLRGAGPEVAQSAFAARAALVASAGVSINFGIVADVTANRRSFIFSRVLGTDAASAAPRVAAAVAGERGIVLSTLKHFPGHGSVGGDSHTSLPATAMSLDEWRATQAPPFQAGIDAGAELVMFGHLRYTAVDAAPASLSAAWHALLRDELGFDGIIVTDDLSMLEHSGDPAFADQAANAVAAVAAGNTLLLYVGPVNVAAVRDAIVAAVVDGRIDEATIDDAVLRLLLARRTLSGQTGPYISCTATCQTLVG
jgi:beta-N-acetylhexosaminidase